MRVFTSPAYESGRIAVDAVIFTIKNQELCVYLNEREKEPFQGLAELPGGLLLEKETAEATLQRKLLDVIGQSEIFFEQFHTFTQPDRDPRVRTVSIGFLALLPEEKVQMPEKFVPVAKLPKFAFDHKEIIALAHAYLQHNIDLELIRPLLPELFTLNRLQAVYEVISGEQVDNRNFRKKMLDSGLIKKVAKKQKAVAHRPAALFSFVD